MNKLLSYFFLILFLSSCGLKKERVFLPIPVRKAQPLIDKVNAANKTPEWLALKGKVNIKREEQDVTLNIRIKCHKDSLIWASISAPFGIELLRIMLTKDSVFYINRTNKTYFIKPITHLSEVLKAAIYFDEIQQMITATPKIINQKYQIASGADSKSTILSTEDIIYQIDEGIFRILSASILDGDNELTYRFSDYTDQSGFVFPKKFNLEVKSVETFGLTLTYSKLVFNESQKTPFKIPISYVDAE